MSLPPLYADECCPAPLVRALRDAGFDAAYVIEQSAGLTDESHARTAFESGRVVVSADYDFGELAVRHLQPFVGLLLLAPDLGLEDPGAAPALAARIALLGERLVGSLTNLELAATRQRRLR